MPGELGNKRLFVHNFLKYKRENFNITKWGGYSQKVVDKKEEAEKKRRATLVHRGYEYSNIDTYKDTKNKGRQRYKDFMRAKNYYFAHSDFRLGYMQKDLFNVMVVAVLQKIFGEDLIQNLKFIKKTLNIRVLNDAVAITFPRRSGKTATVSLFAAICMVSQPNGIKNNNNIFIVTIGGKMSL